MMLNQLAWCLTFLVCVHPQLGGQSLDAATRHADEALHARMQRTSCWVAGPA